MKTTINSENFASTGRPTEYLGSIAIDSLSAEPLPTMEKIISNIVPEYYKQGYSFIGLRVHIGRPQTLSVENTIVVDIVLSKCNNGNSDPDNIVIERKVDLLELVTHLTAISVQFTKKTAFLNDEVDWNNLRNLER